MSKFSVEITWSETVINNAQTNNENYELIDRSIDEVFDRVINQLSEKYHVQFSITNFAEHNVVKRYEHIIYNNERVGILTVSLVTP